LISTLIHSFAIFLKKGGKWVGVFFFHKNGEFCQKLTKNSPKTHQRTCGFGLLKEKEWDF